MSTALQFLLAGLQVAAKFMTWVESSKLKEAYRKVLAENVTRRINDAQIKVNKILETRYGKPPPVDIK